MSTFGKQNQSPKYLIKKLISTTNLTTKQQKPTDRLRSNSCIGIEDNLAIASNLSNTTTKKNDNKKQSNLLSVNNSFVRASGSTSSIPGLLTPTDPVVESSLALRKLSQAFGINFKQII